VFLAGEVREREAPAEPGLGGSLPPVILVRNTVCGLDFAGRFSAKEEVVMMDQPEVVIYTTPT
jgi:hypothetical protein